MTKLCIMSVSYNCNNGVSRTFHKFLYECPVVNFDFVKFFSAYTNKGSNTTVGYSEIIIPKMETSLNFFKGVQDLSTPEVSFSYLNIIKNSVKTHDAKSAVKKIIPLIIYKCNYCQMSFKVESEIVSHLQEVHKMDPNMLCIKCKKSFSVSFLTSLRWKHHCTTAPITLQQHCNQMPIKLK